jgi:hypothetical protein
LWVITETGTPDFSVESPQDGSQATMTSKASVE